MTDLRPSGRVLMVMEATIGGTKRHLHELAMGLQSRGWQIEVACPRVRSESHGDTSFWDDLQAAGVPLIELRMSRSVADLVNLHAVRHLASVIRTANPPFDIVHAHSSIGGAIARFVVFLTGHRGQRPDFGWLSLPITRTKVVYTPHGFAFLEGSPIRRRIYLVAERLLGLLTDRLVAVSPTEASVAVRKRVVSPSRVITIPNGINVHAIYSRDVGLAARQREGWGEAPVVITVARMTAQKDPDTWLRVAAEVARVRADVRFVWVWGGENETAVRITAAQLGILDRVQFAGYRADARELVAGASLFLLTSRFEGLPYAVIESLSSGTPVVATDVVGTRDVVRHGVTGLLGPPGDVATLAGYVLRMLNDPHWAARLAEAGRADVATRFSIDRMVDMTATMYRQVIGTA